MKRLTEFVLILLAVFVASCSRKTEVASPDGSISLSFRLTEEGAPQYAVARDGETVIDWSALGLQCVGQDLTRNFALQGADDRFVHDTWETVWGEEREISDTHNELVVHLKHTSGMEMDITFRVFNDGFAFRYSFSEQEQKSLTITDEASEYRFTADHQAWSIPWRTEYYEGLWTKAPLSAKSDTLCSPITIELQDGGYAFVHEAALRDYPAQNLYYQDGALRTYLTPWLDEHAQPMDVKAYKTVPFPTPWRMVILTIMLNLNPPCRIDDTSWIKPMKFIGIWWGMHIKTMTWEAGPKHGATTANMERYLRFAKQHGIEAVLAEGWNLGWEDWKHFDFTTPYPDWDMDYLSRLADSLGVQIVGHNETGGNALSYVRSTACSSTKVSRACATTAR